MERINVNADPALIFKYILIGDSAVGKSTLMQQYLVQEFLERPQPTIQVELGKKTAKVRDKQVKLEIWDTAGMEKFQTLTQQYYRNSDGCLVVFDVTSRRSFENVSQWIENAKVFSYNGNMVTMLVGNKTDLDSREVEWKEADEFAQSIGVTYMETSAKESSRTSKIFLTMADLIYSKMLGEPAKLSPRPKNIKLKSKGSMRKTKDSLEEGGCC
mmetsp:Transcript_33882/g.44690  ORF Transcript_33882/g.44690 Transcript_33882/m.44690 type:complete len:214 (+) Transcript_33882:140-781(+)|eukprot:CAMPEP_0117752546 /NCGR_PEP_ID=MMETSP0947-20121206/11669_1 /TAXON_ID=44440 /ORGANISM="Chattonella subsalsa, Strain CCMP2191" /LENGTH=213 /DNA_ID=CAMNT_0005571207 /DNA_START=95 /DNA_END=736 /DNA_ORIENTATION=+